MVPKKELSAEAKKKVAAALESIRAKREKLAAEEAKLTAQAPEAPAVAEAPAAQTKPAGKKRTTPKARKPKVAKVAKAPKAAKVPKAKKAAKAKPAKDGEKKKPHTGQSGAAIEDLEYGALNAREKKVVEKLHAEDKNLTIEELSKAFARSAKDEKQANSWTRNALRRLVRGNLVSKIERGVYKLTRRGNNQAAA